MSRWHRALTKAGFNTLATTVYARQLVWDGPDLLFDPDTLGGHLVDEIRAAKKAGLRVVLILRVALEGAEPRNAFLWHGLIQPRDDNALTSWFANYGEFVLHWAQLAQNEGVDVLGLGSELSSLTSTVPIDQLPALEEYYLNEEKQGRERARALLAEGRVASSELQAGWGSTRSSVAEFFDERGEAQAAWARQVTFEGDVERINQRRARLEQGWRTLIGQAREKYHGALVYAANFDQYREVGFWDALDAIGINAYFPLRHALPDLNTSDGESKEEATARAAALSAELETSWGAVLGDLASYRAARRLEDHPVLFTELGYARWQGSTLQPWAGSGFAVLSSGSSSDGSDGSLASTRVVVWREQPLAPLERALAVRALGRALAVFPGMLHGLLYWKLSTVLSHLEIEPFVLVLDAGDPLQRELVALSFRAAGQGIEGANRASPDAALPGRAGS